MLKALRARLNPFRKTRPASGWAQAARSAAEKAPDALEASLEALGDRTAKVAPALLAAAGAGVAVWWWTSWARGRAESEAASETPPKPD